VADVSTRTRRQDRGETKTKTQRRKERWERSLAEARTPEERYAVINDWFRSSVQWMVRRHTKPDPLLGMVHITDPRAAVTAERVLETVGAYLKQTQERLDGGDYDQPS
jgi:hypothetical protein